MQIDIQLLSLMKGFVYNDLFNGYSKLKYKVSTHLFIL